MLNKKNGKAKWKWREERNKRNENWRDERQAKRRDSKRGIGMETDTKEKRENTMWKKNKLRKRN